MFIVTQTIISKLRATAFCLPSAREQHKRVKFISKNFQQMLKLRTQQKETCSELQSGAREVIEHKDSQWNLQIASAFLIKRNKYSK